MGQQGREGREENRVDEHENAHEHQESPGIHPWRAVLLLVVTPPAQYCRVVTVRHHGQGADQGRHYSVRSVGLGAPDAAGVVPVLSSLASVPETGSRPERCPSRSACPATSSNDRARTPSRGRAGCARGRCPSRCRAPARSRCRGSGCHPVGPPAVTASTRKVPASTSPAEVIVGPEAPTAVTTASRSVRSWASSLIRVMTRML